MGAILRSPSAMIRPFGTQELLARIRKILNRGR